MSGGSGILDDVTVTHDVPTLAETLDDLLVAAPDPVPVDALEALRVDLEAAASDAVARLRDAGVEDLLPLRLPKGRLADLQRCERAAVERAGADRAAPSVAMVLGTALDRFVLHEIAVGPVGDPVEDLVAVLDAQGDEQAADDVLALGDDLVERLAPLAGAARAWADLDPHWWPRTQSAVALHLADGRVLSEGFVDVEMGGPLTGRPGVVVEVKSGRPGADHLAEVTHYALLAALRDRSAPAWVLRWYPGAAPVPMPVSAGTLESAARRLGALMERWSSIVAGRPPEESPGAWCGWCPVVDVCASAARPSGPLDELDDPWESEEPWEDDHG
jgi:hypothetical protein